MQLEAKVLLYDSRTACERIIEFTYCRDYEDYARDVYCRSAVERQFQIIGEAMKRLGETAPEVAGQFASLRMIINFRNVLVHIYDRVDHQTVWGIIEEHLPALHERVSRLLAEEE